MSDSEGNTVIWVGIGCGLLVIVSAIFLLWLLRRFYQGAQFKNDTRIDGKVVIITGCTSGIGRVTAIECARRGARVYLAGRDMKRCEDLRKEIVDKTNNVNVYNRTLDLASIQSIHLFVSKFLKEERHLDILINNASTTNVGPRTLTDDGYESQLGVNHMGHFLLTNLLLDTLLNTAPSRIVVVTCESYATGYINRDDLNGVVMYDNTRAFNQSKLGNMLFTRHLAKFLKGSRVTINALHPGHVLPHELQRMHPILRWIIHPIITLTFKTPESGAQTTLRLAIDPDLENVSGKYFSECEEQIPSPVAEDDRAAAWLWNISRIWTGLKPRKDLYKFSFSSHI